MRRFSILLVLVAIACGDGGVAGQSSLGARTTTTPAIEPAASAELESVAPTGNGTLRAQEWGTFTSVQASDGHLLPGMHHADELLPDFVYHRNLGHRTGKGQSGEILLEEPVQQLETPVIYLWSPSKQPVQVDVSFPQGLITQWYPLDSGYGPPQGMATELGGGTMSWSAQLDPSIVPSSFRSVDPDDIWAPSRNVASTALQAYGQSEQFIFYRGLGAFDPGVRVLESRDDTMTIVNDSGDALPAVIVLRSAGTCGAVVSLGPLEAGESRSLHVPVPALPTDSYVAQARGTVFSALRATGLDDDVAQAMVDTWTRSWFGNFGLRVLYLAPPSWPDRLLPTQIAPVPKSYVRTFVGRIESLTPDDEDALLTSLRAASARMWVTEYPFSQLGRFAEPRLQRALEMTQEPGPRSFTSSAVSLVHNQP